MDRQQTWFGPTYFAPPLPVGDLDGDGVADVLLFQQSGPSSGPKEPVLQAYSGKTGRRLWQWDPAEAPEEFAVSECRLLHCVDLDGDGRPEVVFAYGGVVVGRTNGKRVRVVVLNGRTGQVRWQQDGLSDDVAVRGDTLDLVSQGTSGRLAFVVAIEAIEDSKGDRHKIVKYRALDGASGRTIRTWPQTFWPDKSERPKELTSVPWPAEAGRPWPQPPDRFRWGKDDRPGQDEQWLATLDPDTSDGPPSRLYSPHDQEDVTYCRRPVDELAEPLTIDFSGIDPRLSVPLPWAMRSPQRWLPALGAGLVYLALVVGFALARRWRLGLLLLAWMVVFPAVTMWWQFDEANRLFAEECRDWAGWYWFWPDRLSCWAGWETLTNPLVGAGAWLVLWVIVRRPWRSRTARTGG
jgi:hypothetical protein